MSGNADIAEGDQVLVRAIVREAFANETCVRIETGMKGLTQSVWVARAAIVRAPLEEGTSP